MWHPFEDVIVLEGALAEHVHYVISGKVAIVKGDGEQVNVIGRGSCIGDWGVVKEKLRTASCIVRSTVVEVLTITGVNFLAVVDEALLRQITDGAMGAGTFGGANTGRDDATPGGGQVGGIGQSACVHEASFKLISRRATKRAGAAMLAATKGMSQEDKQLGISALDSVLTADGDCNGRPPVTPRQKDNRT